MPGTRNPPLGRAMPSQASVPTTFRAGSVRPHHLAVRDQGCLIDCPSHRWIDIMRLRKDYDRTKPFAMLPRKKRKPRDQLIFNNAISGEHLSQAPFADSQGEFRRWSPAGSSSLRRFYPRSGDPLVCPDPSWELRASSGRSLVEAWPEMWLRDLRDLRGAQTRPCPVFCTAMP